MIRRPLVWHILPPFFALIVVVVAVVGWYACRCLESLQTADIGSSLDSAAGLVAAEIAARPSAVGIGEANALCRKASEASGYRFTIILPSGKVVGDSECDPALMENHADRPEVIGALSAGRGIERRLSRTLNRRMVYVARPAATGGVNVAVVRASLSRASATAAVATARRGVALTGIIAVALIAAIGLHVSRRITRPLAAVQAGAEAIGAGDLAARLPSSYIAEIDVLARTMNRTAAQLAERIETVSRQLDEEDALLASMTEAAIAVNADRSLIRVNKSAAEMFHIVLDRDIGRNVLEVIRNADLLAVIDRALAGGEPVEGDIYLQERDRYLQAHGTALRGPDGGKIGAVVVVSDITRLRRLENLRRDFVANVSHELKTPITAIEGFAETLVEGGPTSEAEQRKFLGIIHQEAARLHSIVNDLLALSTVEHGEQRRTIELSAGSIRPILESAARPLIAGAKAKKTVVRIACDGDVTGKANAQLLEMAVRNLVDNAVKYCPCGSTIDVSAAVEGKEVAIRVKDNGPGIPAEHVPRLFERFYRVDKSRSRQLGGTGLGLAIVKHVAGVHDGRAAVESAPGAGSVFSIVIPAA